MAQAGDRVIQIAALAAMGGLRDPLAKKSLESALQSGDEAIRAVALSSLERMARAQ